MNRHFLATTYGRVPVFCLRGRTDVDRSELLSDWWSRGNSEGPNSQS